MPTPALDTHMQKTPAKSHDSFAFLFVMFELFVYSLLSVLFYFLHRVESLDFHAILHTRDVLDGLACVRLLTPPPPNCVLLP